VILSVICSGVANGLGIVVVTWAVSAALASPVVIYPIVGEALKSRVMVDMIRFSADLMALLSPAIV
jgi:hypothetical protein